MLFYFSTPFSTVYALSISTVDFPTFSYVSVFVSDIFFTLNLNSTGSVNYLVEVFLGAGFGLAPPVAPLGPLTK